VKNYTYNFIAFVFLSMISLDIIAGTCSSKFGSFSKTCTPLEGKIFFVNAQAKGNSDGRSWTNAFSSIQQAITAIENETKLNNDRKVYTIAVARGLFDKSKKSSRLIGRGAGKWISPLLVIERSQAEIHILGGFKNKDKCYEDRSIDANLTILDGGNSMTGIAIVRKDGQNDEQPKILIDGFTLRNFVHGSGQESDGGALYIAGGNVEINNVHFLRNQGLNGAAVAVNDAYVKFTKCKFDSNRAYVSGAALSLSNSKATILACKFKRNHSAEQGGAMNVYNSKLALSNCRFSSNGAQDRGGSVAIYSGQILESENDSVPIKIENCQFGHKELGNFAQKGRDIFAYTNEGKLIIALNNCQFCGSEVQYLGYPRSIAGAGDHIETQGSVEFKNAGPVDFK
jgi:hypothetical protein